MGKSQQETTGAAGTASGADHGKSTWCPQAKARGDGTYGAQVPGPCVPSLCPNLRPQWFDQAS